MVQADDDNRSGRTKQLIRSIIPVYCGRVDGKSGRTRFWWVLTILLFLIIALVILSASWVFQSQYHIVLLGYSSIAGAIAFHMFTNGFSVYSMGVSIRSEWIREVGQEIIQNAVWAVVGTGFLLVSAFLWILKRGDVLIKINQFYQEEFEGVIQIVEVVVYADSQWNLLFSIARISVFLGNVIFLWSLYRHSRCSRWYNDVEEILEEQERINHPYDHLT